MSKSLVKLIDFAILPASLLVLGKFLGLFVSINVFSLQWGLENIPNSFFSVRPVLYAKDIVTASTYSDLIMFLIITSGFSFVLVQALAFHDTHISPAVISKLADHNLLGLIKSTFDIYHKAAVWLIFLWLTVIVIFINVALAKTLLWVLLFSFIIASVLTVFLLRDVAEEIDISKKNSKLTF